MIRRVDFAKEIFKTTTKLDPNATKQIMLSETLIGDLKKLCEKQPTKSNDTKMDIPRTLGQINFITELVMPIEENLQPQLPPVNFRRNQWMTTLVQTS